MTEHRGRDNQEVVAGSSEHEAPEVTRRRPPNSDPNPRNEAVDFDEMGDLDMGAADGRDAERPTGPGPGYGMPPGEGRDPAGRDEQTSFGTPGASPNVDYDDGTLSEPGNFASTMRVTRTDTTDITGGMGSGVGDEQGISQGADVDITAARGDVPSTGTGRRAGLGGRSRGDDEDSDPLVDSKMANPADMGPSS